MKKITPKILIAGPCSAESEGQMKNAAAMLSIINRGAMLRAGCWKPRTSPGAFEGFGEAAVQWIRDAASLYNLEWITEAGTATHADILLRYGVKQIWIGARTTGDPFAVEEIARTLEGTGVHVMIKNPPQPDVKLWLGAVERMHKRGINVSGLIHRGFKVWPNTKWRNTPLWKVADEMKQQFPSIPVITDPSHIAGSVEGVKTITEHAIRSGSEGLMIEMHPHPDNALTDKEQQLTPHQLHELLQRIHCWENRDSLTQLRIRIDEVDDLLWAILGERISLSAEIGRYKELATMPVVQESRMHEVLANYIRLGSRLDLREDVSGKLFAVIHDLSIEKQARMMERSVCIQIDNS